MGNVISMSDYLASRKAKAEAFDSMFINSVIKDEGEDYVARAIELFAEVDDKEAFIVRPDFKMFDEVKYVDDDTVNVGKIIDIKYVDSRFLYMVDWYNDEDADWYNDRQLERL